MNDSESLRQVQEARSRVDARARLATLRRVRGFGLLAIGFGAVVLLRPRTWAPLNPFLRVQWQSGRAVTHSIWAMLGLVAVTVGIAATAVGHILFRKARTAALSDPVTAPVVDDG